MELSAGSNEGVFGINEALELLANAERRRGYNSANASRRTSLSKRELEMLNQWSQRELETSPSTRAAAMRRASGLLGQFAASYKEGGGTRGTYNSTASLLPLRRASDLLGRFVESHNWQGSLTGTDATPTACNATTLFDVVNNSYSAECVGPVQDELEELRRSICNNSVFEDLVEDNTSHPNVWNTTQDAPLFIGQTVNDFQGAGNTPRMFHQDLQDNNFKTSISNSTTAHDTIFSIYQEEPSVQHHALQDHLNMSTMPTSTSASSQVNLYENTTQGPRTATTNGYGADAATCLAGQSGESAHILNFISAMELSASSEGIIRSWDKSMGLKFCHSKTMLRTSKSRKKLLEQCAGISPKKKQRKSNKKAKSKHAIIPEKKKQHSSSPSSSVGSGGENFQTIIQRNCHRALMA